MWPVVPGLSVDHRKVKSYFGGILIPPSTRATSAFRYEFGHQFDRYRGSFSGLRQRRLREDQAHQCALRPGTHWLALLFPDKVGRDAGEIVGIGPIGVTATGSVEEIIAAKPDELTFQGVFPDEDPYVKVLEARIDIVTTADWITGWHRDTNHPHPSGKPVTQLLAEACARGGSSFYGTGMNPGLNQILGVVCSADVVEIENVTTIESVDVSCHHSKDTWIEVGYGLPVDDPSIPAQDWRSTPASSPTACC